MFWVRLVGGAVAGLFVAAFIVFLLEWPTRGWFDNDGQHYKAFVIFFVAAMAGGACAAKIGAMAAAYAVIGLLCVFNLASVLTGTYPWWFLPIAIVVIAIGVFVGSRFVSHPEY